MQEAAILEIQQLRLLMGSDRDPLGRVFAQLADALRRSGELDEAHAVARQGVENDPTFAPGHVVLGWVEQDRGEMDAALDSFHRTLELDPENVFGLFGAGTLLDARGDTEGEVLVAQARELMPGVEKAAPRAVLVPLSDLPFVSLAELAPDGDAGSVERGPEEASAAAVLAEDEMVEDGLEGLPFLSLAELAPDAAGEAVAELVAEPPPEEASAALETLPFVSLEDLAPASPEAAGETSLIEDALAEGATGDAPEEGATEDAVEDGATGHALEEGGTADHGDGVGVEASFADGAADGDDGDDGDDALGDATPVTRTMAEILVGQGLLDRAIDVYRQLVEASPDNAALRERLSELEAQASGEGDAPTTPGESPSERPSEAPSGQTSARAYFGTLLSWGEPAGRSNRMEQGGEGEDAGDDRG